MDVGDTATLTLTVNPVDTDTTATAAAVNPAGSTVALTTSPNSDRSVWTAYLPITTLGAYRVTWTVSGTGAGVEYDTVYALGPDEPATGESYATLGELADYLHDTPPDGAGKLLVRASRRIDTVLIGAYYAVDDDGLPTNATVAAALRDAVCAQVEWWDEQGDATGNGAAGEWLTVGVGKVHLSRTGPRGGGEAVTKRIAPSSLEILQAAGLLPVSPYMVG